MAKKKEKTEAQKSKERLAKANEKAHIDMLYGVLSELNRSNKKLKDQGKWSANK